MKKETTTTLRKFTIAHMWDDLFMIKDHTADKWHSYNNYYGILGYNGNLEISVGSMGSDVYELLIDIDQWCGVFEVLSNIENDIIVDYEGYTIKDTKPYHIRRTYNYDFKNGTKTLKEEINFITQSKPALVVEYDDDAYKKYIDNLFKKGNENKSIVRYSYTQHAKELVLDRVPEYTAETTENGRNILVCSNFVEGRKEIGSGGDGWETSAEWYNKITEREIENFYKKL